MGTIYADLSDIVSRPYRKKDGERNHKVFARAHIYTHTMLEEIRSKLFDAREPGPNVAGLKSDYGLSVSAGPSVEEVAPAPVGQLKAEQSLRRGLQRRGQTGSGGGRGKMNADEIRDKASKHRKAADILDEAADKLEELEDSEDSQ